jgi:hypothetical protein
MVRHTGEDFVDEEGVAVASMFAFQSAGVNGAEFDAPKADGLSADGDASFSKEIFNISVAEIEPVVEPDGVGDNIWRKSVAFIYVHGPILSVTGS